MHKYPRRNKLPKPSMQLRLTLIFVGMLVLTTLLQYLLFTSSLTKIAVSMPNDGMFLMEQTNGVMFDLLWCSAVVFLPIAFFTGILATFRVAGPLYRFESHLRQIAAGNHPGPCKLRRGDQLQDLCDLINEVTLPLRPDADEQQSEQERLRTKATRFPLEALPSLLPEEHANADDDRAQESASTV